MMKKQKLNENQAIAVLTGEILRNLPMKPLRQEANKVLMSCGIQQVA